MTVTARLSGVLAVLVGSGLSVMTAAVQRLAAVLAPGRWSDRSVPVPRGGFGLTPEWVAGRPEVWGRSGANTGRALYAIFQDGSWAVRAAGTAAPAAVRLNAAGQLSACSGRPS